MKNIYIIMLLVICLFIGNFAHSQSVVGGQLDLIGFEQQTPASIDDEFLIEKTDSLYPRKIRSCPNSTDKKYNNSEHDTITNLKASVSDFNISLSWSAPDINSDESSSLTVVLDEDFEKGMGEWKVIDADGDQNKWVIVKFKNNSSYSGGYFALSLSFIHPSMKNLPFVVGEAPSALNPNNYLITPELNLTNKAILKYYIASQDATFKDHYGIFLSSTGNSVEDFDNEPIFEEVAVKEWTEKTLEIPAGTKYIAFRHYNSESRFAIKLDDVKITCANLPNYTYSVYRNQQMIINLPPETSHYTDINVAPGEYEYCVEVNYPENLSSNKVCKKVTLLDVSIEKKHDYRLIVLAGDSSINFDCETATEFKIYDASGRLITKTIKQGISSDFYTPGLYIIHYNIGNYSNVIKLIVR